MKHIIYTTFFFLLANVAASFGQVTFTAGNLTQTENFDGLITSGTDQTWTDNSTITGGYATETVYDASAGTSATGAMYSFGTGTNTERALGSVVSAGTGTIIYGMRYLNSTGSTIVSLDISFTGEQWRRQSSTNTLAFAYQVAAVGVITDINVGTWTTDTNLDFAGPVTGSGTSLDGNLGTNQTAVAATLTVNVPNGEELWIRWTDVDDSGADQGLAIDDLSITAVLVKAEPTNHPTAFTITSTTETTATMTWTDATGAVLPDTYIIKGSTVSDAAIVAPVDGTAEADATLILNISHGSGGTATFTGLLGGTTYYFRIYSYTNSSNNVDYKTDGTIQSGNGTTVVKAEPTNHPTVFAGLGATATTITLSWTDAVGAVTPDAYLILGSTTSFAAITDPVDATAQADDNANLILNISHGSGGTATFTGLTQGTIYYFKIYSYSNMSTDIDYKTDGTIEEHTTAPLNAWINEFHYENTGADANEFVEIVIQHSSDYTLSDFTVTLYNGNDGLALNTQTVDAYTVGNTETTYTYYYLVYGSIQNGPDGLALSYNGTLILFLSYEGTFTANDGAANGILSTDVGVSETNSTLENSSLGLTGQGLTYADHSWTTFSGANTATTGANTNQTPLPVALINFQLAKNNKNITISWQTASELNNDYFELQRSSNGFSFDKIATVQGMGTSSQLNSYTFTDKNPVNGTNYYRLKQIDFNGQFEFSELRAINMNTNELSVALYPNPIESNNFFLQMGAVIESNILVTVYDLSGKIVLTQNIKNKQSSKIEISLPQDAMKGMYYVSVFCNGKRINKKVIKN